MSNDGYIWDKVYLNIDPLDAMGICLKKQKLMYKVLLLPLYEFLWTYGGSGHVYL